MKRVLWFLALFVTGLCVLFWFESKRKGGSAVPLISSGAPAEGPSPGSVPEGPSGHFTFVRYDESDPALRRRLWNLDFEELAYDAQSSEFEAARSRLERFDPLTGEAVANLVARSSRMPSAHGARPGAYELGSKITLRSVEAELLQAGTLSPLHLSAAELSGDLDQQAFWTPGRATIRGTGLDSSGLGMRIEMAQSKLKYDSRARVRLEFGAHDALELSSEGPLEVTSASKQDGGMLTVVASGRAQLSSSRMTGANAQRPGALAAGAFENVVLAGERVTVIAVPGADGALVLQQVHGEGAASLARGAWRADGERANVVFGPTGDPLELRVEGAPVVHLPLQGTQLAPGAEALWSGAGPLVASGEDPVVLTMAGPTRVVVLKHELRAQTELRAYLPKRAGEPRRLVAVGAVALTSNGWEFGAPELEAVFREPTPGVLTVDAQTRGSTLLRPLAADSQGRWMRAQQGARLSVTGSNWTLPSARGAEVHWTGAQPLEAHAAEILDFDPAGPSFRAEGSFVLVSGDVTASGLRATVRDLDHAFVEGTLDSPALIERPGDRISALYVERDGETLRARGNIDALREGDGLRQSVLADELEVRRSEQRESDGSLTRHYEMESRGSVRASLTDDRSSADIVCASLSAIADMIEPAPPATEHDVQRATSFEALGVVQSRLQVGDDVWELACGRLAGSALAVGAWRKVHVPLTAVPEIEVPESSAVDATPLEARLDAWDGVSFSRLGPVPLRGRAEHLVLVGPAHAELEAKPGERVHAEGLLSSSATRAFRIDAAALTFDGGQWRAVEPELWVYAPSADGAAVLRPEDPDLLWMRADDIRYLAPLLNLEGDAQIRGTATPGERFDIAAERLRFVLADTPDTLVRRIQGLTASGGFRMHYGAILSATGEELVLERGPASLRMTGRPVHVDWLGVAFSSAWVEIDLLLRALRTGPFAARPADVSRSGRP
jgi:hypothetical protein